MNWRWVLGALGLAFVALAATVAFGAWNPFAASYPQGVDVSWRQGPIDWPALARGNVRFAYVKATEGSDYSLGGAGYTNLDSSKVVVKVPSIGMKA